MAQIIPTLTRATLRHMTSGEKRLAERLSKYLDDDYLIWYDIPVGRLRRYPDFIVLHPERGLLFLEVKDWKLNTLKQINKETAQLQTGSGLVEQSNPLAQARGCMMSLVNQLNKDPQLLQKKGRYQGKLIFPYACGVVFSNITRKQWEANTDAAEREAVLPDHLLVCKDEMTESIDPELFQTRLWEMFPYHFHRSLNRFEVDRVRWHLFPEMHIQAHTESREKSADRGSQLNDEALAHNIPDIVRIMDLQQEQLARSLGEGHRVVHGVAGSGKTMILGFRCVQLAQALKKPILVLCFNVVLAAKLRSQLRDKVAEQSVVITHFHDWCKQQITTYQLSVEAGSQPHYARSVNAVMKGVEEDRVPREQYGALLIDEGHDFEADWLTLVVQMVDKSSGHLLMLYDDAQSIYQSRSGLGFSLSSVGIKARGRTTILRLNYRNTRKILAFSQDFSLGLLRASDDRSQQAVNTKKKPQNEDAIPYLEPEAVGICGEFPYFRQLSSFNQEIIFSVKCLKKWASNGVSWQEVAILCLSKQQIEQVRHQLNQVGIPNQSLQSNVNKKTYDTRRNQVTITTIHSSKGLEFPRVIVIGMGHIYTDQQRDTSYYSRLLYVGMTRAQEHLVLLASAHNFVSKQLEKTYQRLVG